MARSRFLRPCQVDVFLLEELVARELAAALNQVSHGRRAEAGQERRGAFFGDDLARGTDHVHAFHCVVDLYAGFYYVYGCRGLLHYISAVREVFSLEFVRVHAVCISYVSTGDGLTPCVAVAARAPAPKNLT
ncbi:hypothetical protein RRF57_011569 [Xylaria bambusicola]|uniref:Uncharacterized protein n=1 Tax=Xylaria bambusicola TaxID=326684 RepID=A0AAN7ZA47_9PEZI